MAPKTETAPLAPLDALFHARTVAVIGASENFSRLGGRPLKYLLKYGYRGRIYPINPKYETIAGLACYPSLQAVPERIDLVLIAIAKAMVPDAIRECAAAGVPAVIMFSSGYSEADAEGALAQAELLALARSLGVRVLGPNAMGIMNVHESLMMTFSTVLERSHLAGPLALVSQSGAYAAYIMAQARAARFGFSLFASSGNEMDIQLGELLAYMVRDPETAAVIGYIEEIRDGDAFVRAAEDGLRLGKPILLVKVGRSSVGAEAARSHTGALAGSYAVYRAVFDELGVIAGDTVDDVMDVATLVNAGLAPTGDRLGILSISGGAGVLMADAAIERGLQVPPLPDSVQAALRRTLPFAGVVNPVDFTPQVFNNPDLYGGFLEAVMGWDGVDALFVFLAHAVQYEEALGLRLVAETERARARFNKPVVLCGLPGDDTPVADALRAARIPAFVDPSRAVRAYAALLRWQQARQRVRTGVRSTPVSAIAAQPAATEPAAKRVLGGAGVPVTREHVATDQAGAVVAARDIGFPVAMKLVSPDIAHKSDIGGVALGLGDPRAVEAAYESLMAAAAKGAPGARIEGILVQEMVGDGVAELILGARVDPVFGPVVLVGMGGVFAEILKDSVLHRAPVDQGEAEAMLSRLAGYSLLRGARGRPEADVTAAAAAVVALSRFIAGARSWVAEVDINPLIVRRAGAGAVAADALIVERVPA